LDSSRVRAGPQARFDAIQCVAVRQSTILPTSAPSIGAPETLIIFLTSACGPSAMQKPRPREATGAF
jgi:hypothetical protein